MVALAQPMVETLYRHSTMRFVRVKGCEVIVSERGDRRTRPRLLAAALVVALSTAASCVTTPTYPSRDQAAVDACAWPVGGPLSAQAGLDVTAVTAGVGDAPRSLRMPKGPTIFFAPTTVSFSAYAETTVESLRARFRRESALSERSSPLDQYVDRSGAGYHRAPFQPQMTADDAARESVAGTDAYVAYTQWRITETGWEQGAIVEDGGEFRFDPTKLFARVTTSMRLPSWPSAATRPASERATWHRFICALRQHESVHADVGVAVARAVLESLVQLRAQSPAALEAHYYAVWRQGIRWGNDEDARFDAFTNHGPLL